MVISRDLLPGNAKSKIKSKIKSKVDDVKADVKDRVEEAKDKVKGRVEDIKDQAKSAAAALDSVRKPPEDPMKNRPKKEDEVVVGDSPKP